MSSKFIRTEAATFHVIGKKTRRYCQLSQLQATGRGEGGNKGLTMSQLTSCQCVKVMQKCAKNFTLLI